MSYEPSGLEILFLWRLAIDGGGGWKKEVKPDLEGPSRKRLMNAGLIEEEKRSPDGGGRKLLFFSLTEQGWQWLSKHLNAPVSTKSPAAVEILVRFLGRLQKHFDSKGLSLAEFIQSDHGGERAGRTSNLDQQIEAVYYDLSEGRPNVRVRLADLRSALSEVPRHDLDAELLHMAEAGQASLYRLDNPQEITPRDREATLHTPGGEERHVVYLGGRGS